MQKSHLLGILNVGSTLHPSTFMNQIYVLYNDMCTFMRVGNACKCTHRCRGWAHHRSSRASMHMMKTVQIGLCRIPNSIVQGCACTSTSASWGMRQKQLPCSCMAARAHTGDLNLYTYNHALLHVNAKPCYLMQYQPWQPYSKSMFEDDGCEWKITANHGCRFYKKGGL